MYLSKEETSSSSNEVFWAQMVLSSSTTWWLEILEKPFYILKNPRCCNGEGAWTKVMVHVQVLIVQAYYEVAYINRYIWNCNLREYELWSESSNFKTHGTLDECIGTSSNELEAT